MEKEGKEDRSEWASLFFGDWHLINSRSFMTNRFIPDFAGMRVFNYRRDPEEVSYLNWYYSDLVLKYKVTAAIHTLQDYNMQIWKNLASGTDQDILYDPEAYEQLKSLGYLQ